AAYLRAIKLLKPSAGRARENDKTANVALAGEGGRAAPNIDVVRFEFCRQRVKRSRISDLPAKERDALAAIGRDHEPLLAIIHAEGERGTCFVEALEPQEIGAVACPVVQIFAANPDIAQRFDAHRGVLTFYRALPAAL